MEEEILGFIVYLHNVKRMSANTEMSYKRDLAKLKGFLEEQGIQGIEKVTPTTLNSYILYLEKKQFAAATISRNIASMKAFFHYLWKEGKVEGDLTEMLKPPKIVRRPPEILTMEEVVRLLEQPGGNSPKEMRDKAMLELLYATGIRVTELISLKEVDVNLPMGYIICRDSNKERTIPFGGKAKEALVRYLEQSRQALSFGKGTNVLFTNCSGKPMSRQGFWKIIKNYAKKAGITADITPSFFCSPFSGKWSGLEKCTGDVRSFRHFHNPGLCKYES